MKMERRGLLALLGGAVGIGAIKHPSRDVVADPSMVTPRSSVNCYTLEPNHNQALTALARLRADVRSVKLAVEAWPSVGTAQGEDWEAWELSPAMVDYLAWDVTSHHQFVFPGLQRERAGGRRLEDRRHFAGSDVRIRRDIPNNDVCFVRWVTTNDGCRVGHIARLSGVEWGLRG